MNARKVVRQGFKMIFWPITIPILSVCVFIVPIVAFASWAWEAEDTTYSRYAHHPLGWYIGHEYGLFYKELRFVMFA